MSKIIGVTVGTPISPKTIEDQLKPVKTVNGVAPDKNGNVDVEVEGGVAPLMVVYTGQGEPTGIATRTAKEIYDHVTAGGRAVWWCEFAESYIELMCCDEEKAYFTFVTVEEDMAYGVVIGADGWYEIFEKTYINSDYMNIMLSPIENRLAALENIPNASGVSF